MRAITLDMKTLYLDSTPQSKLNFYNELTILLDAAELTERSARYKKIYQQTRPDKMEHQARLDFNEGLVGTPDQIKRIRSWGRNLKQHLLLIHIIGCGFIADKRAKKAVHQRVPLPHTFLDEFRLRGEIADLVKRGILEKLDHVNKGHSSKGRCARYRLKRDKYEMFIAKGINGIRRAKFALSVLAPKWSALIDRQHPRLDVKTTSELQVNRAAVEHPSKATGCGGEKIEQQQHLVINIKALHDKLTQHNKQIEAMAQSPAKETARASQQHTARCVALIQAQVTKAGKDGLASYRPKYIQTEEHLRQYEVGGGYQGLPKEYKDIALTGTGQTNADFKAAHPTILHQISMHLFGDSPLTEILKGNYPTIGTLTRKAVKKIICAVINKAKVGKIKASSKYAIANICNENGGDRGEVQHNINAAVLKGRELAARVHAIEKHWIGLDKANDRGRATMSELYQTIEQQALSMVTKGQHAANEHDGWVTQHTTDQQQGTVSADTQLGVITLEWEASHYKRNEQSADTKAARGTTTPRGATTPRETKDYPVLNNSISNSTTWDIYNLIDC